MAAGSAVAGRARRSRRPGQPLGARVEAVAAQHPPDAVGLTMMPPHLARASSPRSVAARARGGRARRPRSAARPAPRAGWASAAGAAHAAAASPGRAGRPAASTRSRSSGAPQTPGTPGRPSCAPPDRTAASGSRTERHHPSCGSRPFKGPEDPESVSRTPDVAASLTVGDVRVVDHADQPQNCRGS